MFNVVVLAGWRRIRGTPRQRWQSTTAARLVDDMVDERRNFE